MITEVNVELFRFDSEVDYLPYYKKYIIEYKLNETILDLLNKINQIEKFAYVTNGDFNLVVNNIYLNANELISTVVEKSSNIFIIEPISTYRAVKDLMINKSDYLQKINMFELYIDSKKIANYAKDYELDYYASNTYNINKDYIGDHALLIASDIIEENPNLKDDILKIISSKEDGIWYHTSLKNRVLDYDMAKEQKIENLFNMLKKSKTVEANEKIDMKNIKIHQFFKGFNIASFVGIDKNSCKESIEKSRANHVEISLANEDLAQYANSLRSDFRLKIAGGVLLQAKDSNADFIVVRGKSDIALFDGEQKNIEKAVGREIALPVICQEQFKMLLEGEKNPSVLGFDKHKVKVSFL